MSPGSSTESYPTFSRIGLRENPGKTSTRYLPSTDGPFRRYLSSSSVSLEPLLILALRCAVVDGRSGAVGLKPDDLWRVLGITSFHPFHLITWLAFFRGFPQPKGKCRSLMLAGSEFQSLGRAIVKEDEYEEVRWDSIVSRRERVFRLWWEERRLRWAGHVARMGESRNAYRVLVGRPEGKRPLGKPRRGWEDNIKMYLREVGYDDRDWINITQDRNLWRAAMKLRVAWRPVSKVHYTGEALRNATEPVHSGFDLNEAAKKFGVLKATLASRSKYPVEGKVFFGPRPVLGEAICNSS
ncbi:hypothetical protein ANN_10427 [Periplaneta americana]|uniref:Uncharacterized protein n=1 Tax=Periplaneta americana TaxID=6978 RepID=A0ABQ8TRA0_PERAM|nr:hypothetical protein ANN_10427 [Periplaneta americana]